jgi:signal peptidase I
VTAEDRDPDEGSRSSSVPGPTQGRRRLTLWQETLLLLAIALVLALVLKTFFVQAFYIPSESMEPGLVEDDRILVEKPSYWFGEPERGDVVVFEDPGGWLPPEDDEEPRGVAGLLAKVGLYPTGGHLVKRVIGVAGDVIRCCDEQGRLLVNGQPLDEDDYVQLDGATCHGPMVNRCTEDWEVGPVPDGRLFVMGDNRSHSGDSSFHGCLDAAPGVTCDDSPWVDVDGVVGRVFVLIWPSDRFGFLHRPATFDDVPGAS